MEALLDEDSCQTLTELAESLVIDHATVSKRLKPFKIIQKQENWMPYELKPRDVERRLFRREQLLQRQKKRGFLHRIVTGDEN